MGRHPGWMIEVKDGATRFMVIAVTRIVHIGRPFERDIAVASLQPNGAFRLQGYPASITAPRLTNLGIGAGYVEIDGRTFRDRNG